jgi:hypothetical protein
MDHGLHYFQYHLDQQRGFFLDCQEDLIVFDVKGDGVLVRETDRDQLDRIRLNLKEFENSIGYIQEENHIDIWNQLVRFLTTENLSILPAEISPVGCTSLHSEKLSQPPSTSIIENSTIQDYIDFLPIDLAKSFPLNDLSLRTKYSLDKSYLLNSILKLKSEEYVIGELALSFILFQVSHIFDGFEQWKVLVSMFCHSNEAIGTYPTLFLKFMDLLQIHLQEFPLDFFQDELSSTSFLVESLHVFSLNCRDHPELVEIQDRLDRLLGFIDSRFTWNLSHNIVDIEDGEYAPVIVDT